MQVGCYGVSIKIQSRCNGPTLIDIRVLSISLISLRMLRVFIYYKILHLNIYLTILTIDLFSLNELAGGSSWVLPVCFFKNGNFSITFETRIMSSA